MNSSIHFALDQPGNAIIKVIGVGGGGGNAVNNMFRNGIAGVDFIICNTDKQVLDNSPVPNKIQLGNTLTVGLGAGADPEVGKKAAIESLEEIRSIIGSNTKMIFITAGMGGGTGTGAAPVIAKLAKDMNILTVGIVTTPFSFEGSWRNQLAKQGLSELQNQVDSLLVINNNRLMSMCNSKEMKVEDAFFIADQVLSNAAKGIAEIITIPGKINVDFADVQTIMKNSGTALMGMATRNGENRAIEAIEDALSSPLLDDVNITGATGVLVNITTSFSNQLTMNELEAIGSHLHAAAGDNARIIMGSVVDEEEKDTLTVTVIATGFKRNPNHFEPKKPQTKLSNNSTPQSINSFAKPSVTDQESIKSTNTSSRNTTILDKDTLIIEKERINQPPVLKQEPSAAFKPLKNHHSKPEKKMTLVINPEDRLKKMIQMDIDYHNPTTIKYLEDVPAYERRKETIEKHQEVSLSRLSIESKNSGKFSLRDSNSYLFDNPD